MKNFSIPQLNADDINRQTDLLALAERVTTLKKVSKTGGGEYCGPCPFCHGGTDRFRLQLKAPPGKLPQGQRWMCRQCSDHWGDAIGFVMKRDNCEFTQALKTMADDNPAPMVTEERPQAEEPSINRLAWTNTAYSFIATAEKKLWQPEGRGALKYLYYRGLKDETLEHWRIGYNPDQGYDDPVKWGLPPEDKIFIPKGIVIPCEDLAGLHYVKIRRKEGDPKYWILKGGEMWPFGMQTYSDALTAFLFEGEFDCLLAWQTGLGVGFASLPAGQDLRAAHGRFFQTVEDVIVAYDNDEPGEKAAAKLLKLQHFHQAPPLEVGKDLTEYFLLGGDVFEYIYQALGAI